LAAFAVFDAGQAPRALGLYKPGCPFPGLNHYGALLGVHIAVVGCPASSDFLAVLLPTRDGGVEPVATYEGDEEGLRLLVTSHAAEEFLLPDLIPRPPTEGGGKG
jgi:hypothetical protein